MINSTCSFCAADATDSALLEAGNKAWVTAYLCDVHVEELDRMQYHFEEKYAEVLNRLADESLEVG